MFSSSSSSEGFSPPPPFEFSLLPALSGSWVGSSFPSAKPSESTAWQNCKLIFSSDGKIEGFGFSQWRSELIEFSLVGSVDPPKAEFELYKTHTGKFTNTIIYKGNIRIDQWPFLIDGRYSGGKLRLTKVNDSGVDQNYSNEKFFLSEFSEKIPEISTNQERKIATPTLTKQISPATPNININQSMPAPVPVPVPIPPPIPASISLTAAPPPPLPRQISNSASLQILSGIWEGHALQRPAILTRFSDLLMKFSGTGARDGEFEGFGISNTKGDRRGFRIMGKFDLIAASGRVIIAISNSNDPKTPILFTSFSAALDVASLSLRGESQTDAGRQTLVLSHTKKYHAEIPSEPSILPDFILVKNFLNSQTQNFANRNSNNQTNNSAFHSIQQNSQSLTINQPQIHLNSLQSQISPATLDIRPPVAVAHRTSLSRYQPPLSASVSLPLEFANSSDLPPVANQYRRATTLESPAVYEAKNSRPAAPPAIVASFASFSASLPPSFAFSFQNSDPKQRTSASEVAAALIRSAQKQQEIQAAGERENQSEEGEVEGKRNFNRPWSEEGEGDDEESSDSASEGESENENRLRMSPGWVEINDRLNQLQISPQPSAAENFNEISQSAGRLSLSPGHCEGEPEPVEFSSRSARVFSLDSAAEPGRNS